MWLLCICMNIFSAGMDYIFLHLFLETRKLKKGLFLLWLVAMNTLCLVVAVFAGSAIYYIIVDTLIIVMVSIIFEVRDKQKMCLLFLLLAMGIAIDLSLDFLVALMNLPQELPMSSGAIVYCVSIVLENIIRYLVVLVILRNAGSRLINRKDAVFELLYIPLVCLFILLGVISFVGLSYRIQEKQLRYAIEALVCLVDILVCILSLKINKMYYNNLHMNAYLEYMQSKGDYYRQLEAQQDEIRRIKHDWKNHMIYLQGLLMNNNVEDVLAYMEEVIGVDLIIGNVSYTAHAAVNIVLNAKILLMKQKDITFAYNIQLPDKMSIREKDIVAVLGNIMDNAIEAAEQCHQSRKIELTMVFCNSQLVIECINSTNDHKISTVTKKKDKLHHGIGLGNVNRIVGWYGGAMQRKIQNGKFVIKVSLPEDENCADSEWNMTVAQ